MSNPKELVAQIAAEADTTAEDPMPSSAKPQRTTKSVTVATRISPTDLAAIEARATQLDTPVSALVRGWILDGLNTARSETVAGTVERLSGDLLQLGKLLAGLADTGIAGPAANGDKVA